ncbi:MAG: toll/interleukin-1 receptor domain-containing protein, partial [Bdellovibrionales bacterium]
SSDDKESLIEPLAKDLEDCYINVWLDKKRIIPGDNLRKSIFREGLDKADVVLIFFTANSLKSSWVDREIKHVLRDERNKGNNFDLNKIISIFDSDETYKTISERYPELTDDLLHLMPSGYTSIQLGQLISAIWSKYLSLQGGDVATQRQFLEKDREILRKEHQVQEIKEKIDKLKANQKTNSNAEEFETILASKAIDKFLEKKTAVLTETNLLCADLPNSSEARAFGLIAQHQNNPKFIRLTDKGCEFFKWLILKNAKSSP